MSTTIELPVLPKGYEYILVTGYHDTESEEEKVCHIYIRKYNSSKLELTKAQVLNAISNANIGITSIAGKKLVKDLGL